MRKLLPLVAVLIGLIIPPPGVSGFQTAPPQSGGTAATSATRVFQPAETQSDFDLMRKALEEAHSGLYRYSTKDEMNSAFDAQRARLNRPVTKVEFIAVIRETLARIRCGHTDVGPDEEMRAIVANARWFPLRLIIEGRRLVVLFNDTPDDQTIRPGMEVIEINRRKAGDILDRILPKLPGDGDIEACRRARLQRNFALYYWMFVDPADGFLVKARDAAGRMVTTKLAGVTQASRASNRNPVNNDVQPNLDKLNWSTGNLSLRFLKDPEIAQIRIRGFQGGDYRQWMENTFRTLSEKGTKTLIIDLRGNGGGDDTYGAMLVSYLTDKPFRYFDHINVKTIQPSFKEHSNWNEHQERELRKDTEPNPSGGYLVTLKGHPGVGEQSPGKHPFLGKVFVLTDGLTFSTSADFCAVTHHLKRATFIGEETGGGYYGNNSGAETILTLPNLKARVVIPMYEYWNAVPGYDGKRRGTRPDYAVETKAANLLRGIDAQLEKALQLAGK